MHFAYSFTFPGQMVSELEHRHDFHTSDLDLWPMWAKNDRVPPWAMGKTCVKFHIPRANSFWLNLQKDFSNEVHLLPWPWTYWPQNDRVPPWAKENICVKLQIPWANEWVRRWKQFSKSTCDLDLWIMWSNINKAPSRAMGNISVKFHIPRSSFFLVWVRKQNT